MKKNQEKYLERCSENGDEVCDFVESLQCAMVRAGSTFPSRFKLEKMTIEELNDLLSSNFIKAKFCRDTD